MLAFVVGEAPRDAWGGASCRDGHCRRFPPSADEKHAAGRRGPAAAATLRFGLDVDEKAVVAPPSLAPTSAPSRAAVRNPKN
jgi:hypothetical protein